MVYSFCFSLYIVFTSTVIISHCAIVRYMYFTQIVRYIFVNVCAEFLLTYSALYDKIGNVMRAVATTKGELKMKWTRATKEFSYAPYVSADGKFRVQDMNDQPIVPEYNELKRHNWDNKQTHARFMSYCKENKISLSGANWVLVNNETNEAIKFPFKTAKAAKEYAETL